MTSNTLVRLILKYADASRAAEQILGIYSDVHMAGDLDQLAWNLAGCDSERQAAEIGGPRIESHEVKRGKNGDLDLVAVLEFSGFNQTLIRKTVEDYLDAFGDYIRETVLEYESHEGSQTRFDGRPVSWSFNSIGEGK